MGCRPCVPCPPWRQLAQRLQMEVNRTSANRAAAQRGNERFTQTVHERAGKQDRDARRTGQCIHVGHIGQLHTRGVDGHNAVRTVHIHVRRADVANRTPHARHESPARSSAPTLPGASNAATIALLTKFFAPRTLIVPFKGFAALDMQHVIRILSHATLLNQSRFKNATVQFAISHVADSVKCTPAEL